MNGGAVDGLVGSDNPQVAIFFMASCRGSSTPP
jgi:hypothetical protein